MMGCLLQSAKNFCPAGDLNTATAEAAVAAHDAPKYKYVSRILARTC